MYAKTERQAERHIMLSGLLLGRLSPPWSQPEAGPAAPVSVHWQGTGWSRLKERQVMALPMRRVQEGVGVGGGSESESESESERERERESEREKERERLRWDTSCGRAL